MTKHARFSKVLTWALTLSVIALIWLYPLIAYADAGTVTPDPTPAGPVSEIFTMALKIVFSVLGLVASFLTMKAIQYFEKKTNIDIPASTEKMILDWADQGIGFAHEKSHQILQKTGTKLDGNEKLNLAAGFVADLIKKHELDAVAETKLKDYIESKLGTKRMDPQVPVVPADVPPA